MVDNHFSPPKDRDAIEADDAMMGCFDGFPVDLFKRVLGDWQGFWELKIWRGSYCYWCFWLSMEFLVKGRILLYEESLFKGGFCFMIFAFGGIPFSREDFAL